MPSSTSSAFLIALAWRIFTATTTRTFFQPDEFYQSLEVAHHAVFGYGHLTWEWSTNPPIRSIVFPALYMPVYWLLKVTKTDDTVLLIIAPKVLQGCFAALTDISTRKLAKEILGVRYANTAFYLSLFSFFHFLCLGRTLSNSVETSLTTAALCFWPWHLSGTDDDSDMPIAVALAAASCMVRPTSAVLWIFLALDLLWRSNLESIRLSRIIWRLRHESGRHINLLWRARLQIGRFSEALILNLAFIGALSMMVLYSIDSWYFQKSTFTPLNFLITNLSSVSSFYGLNDWHFYLSQGLPILLNAQWFFFAWGSWTIMKCGFPHQKSLVHLVVWTTTIYSLLGHKEWRFLHPILPISLIISSLAIVDFIKKRPGTRVFIWSAMLFQSVLLGIYVMYFHGRAQIDVLTYLRSLDESDLKSVGFLMPCHSTPWQSHLHKSYLSRDGYLWALGCEPPLHIAKSRGDEIAHYRDQSDVFYSSPLTYLQLNFPTTVNPDFPPSPSPSTIAGGPPPADDRWDHRWPSHLVFFGALLDEDNGKAVESYLRHLGYGEVWIGSNGFEQDWRRRGGVQVWKWHAIPDH